MSDKDFVSRWSERKRKVAEEERLVDAVPVEEPVSEPVVEEKSDEAILEEFGLKDPDALVMGDDFSGFMNAAIPARIRNRALRKLWVSNPTLAALDGLVDYGDDYTDAATVVENMQTAYQVGKGIVKKLAVIESDLAALDETKGADLIESSADVATEGTDAEHAENIGAGEQVAAEPQDTEAAQMEPIAETEFFEIEKNNRRMSFHFDGDA